MAWTGVPSGADLVSITRISPTGDKFVGRVFGSGYGDYGTPWVWSEASGNTTLAAGDIGERVAQSAALGVYPSATASTGVFVVWDGATSRTFTTLTGRDALSVVAVSQNGDHAVLRLALGSAFTFYAAKNLLTYLATGSGLALHDLIVPSGYNAYLNVTSISNAGVVYGFATTTGGVKQLFVAPSSGTVPIIAGTDVASGTSVGGVADLSGEDRAAYTVYSSPYYAVKEYASSVVDRTPTYGAYVTGTNGVVLFGGLGTTAGEFVPAKCVGGIWTALSTSSGACSYVNSDGDDLSEIYDENGLGVVTINGTALSAIPSWPVGTSYSIGAWSDDLSTVVVIAYDEASEAEAAYLWTASGYVPLFAVDTGGDIAAALASVSSVTASLSVGARLSAALTSTATLSAFLPQLDLSIDAALTSEATATASLTTSIRLSCALTNEASVVAVLIAGDPTIQAALTSSSSVAASLATDIRLEATLAATGGLTASLVAAIGFHAALASEHSVAAQLSTTIQMRSLLLQTATLGAALDTGILMTASLASRTKHWARLTDTNEGMFRVARYAKKNTEQVTVMTRRPQQVYVM